MPKSLDDIWAAIDDLQAGLFRAPVGPGGIRAKMIKPKSVYASTIDVSDLQSVNAKTGSLSVTGGITMTTAGAFSAGQTAYDTGVGFWLEYNAGTPRFSLGNSGGSKLTWNGTTLAITGTITATSGTIGGWTIGSTDLTGSAGVIGLASSGSVRIWSGHATPASAPFQVDSLGNLTATAGAIGGWTIDSTLGLKLGTTTSTRGISTGATAFYAGDATPGSAPFRVSTAGALVAESATITGTISTGNITATGGTIGGITINATSISSTGFTLTNAGVMTSTSGTVGGLTIASDSLTVPSGKKIKFGASAADYLDNNLLHFEVAASETGKIEFKNGAIANYSYMAAYAATDLTFLNTYALGTTNRKAGTEIRGTATDAGTYARIYVDSTASAKTALSVGADGLLSFVSAGISNSRMAYSQTVGWTFTLNDAAGSYAFAVKDSASQTQFSISSNGAFVYPDADATALGAYAGRIPWYVNGNLKYIPYYDA